ANGIISMISFIPLAHNRKIQALVGRYHTPPTLRLNGKNGQEFILDYDQANIVSLVVRRD
ncbi:MAG: hypothetical protein SVW57_10485, partial [Thermodesulfobacteriota bacterium]|nr:hypothetical protein [Thermodesulfobacteriota bacterium]